MNDSEIRAFLTIALMAALADGAKDDRESVALKSLAGRLGEGRIDLTDVYDDVLVRKISIADAVRPITTTEGRAGLCGVSRCRRGCRGHRQRERCRAGPP